MRVPAVLLIPLLTGCWKTEDFTPLGGITFDPTACQPEGAAAAPCAVDGWVVEVYELDMICPDGDTTRAYLLHPESPTGAQPLAVFFHSGAFDYVRNPSAAGDPVSGQHLHDEVPRLEFEWAVRKVFATLGMDPDKGGQPERHTGALPIALAEAGVSSFFAANCWGDYWHNHPTTAPNRSDTERFERRGGELAEWAWRVATDGPFRDSQGVDFPITVDKDAIYMVGQGEGGRAVGELLTAGKTPAAVLVDSTADDLQAFYDGNQQIYGSTVTGLDRIFPDGKTSTTDGALGWAAKYPPRVAYLYSELDSQIPKKAHDKILTRLENQPGDEWVFKSSASAHVLTGSDLDLARDAVEYLVGN